MVALSVITFQQLHAQATNAAGTQPAVLALSNAIELSFTGNTATIVNIPFTTLNDLLNGVETANHTLNVSSNKPYTVTVKQSSNQLTYSGTSLLPLLLQVSNVMKVKVENNGTGGTQPLLALLLGWQAFNALGLPVTLLNNCPAGGNKTFDVKYKATPGINVSSGTYTVEMVYTATQI